MSFVRCKSEVTFLNANAISRLTVERRKDWFEYQRTSRILTIHIKTMIPVILRAKVSNFISLFLQKQLARLEADQLRLLA